jgi:hypothetical protein
VAAAARARCSATRLIKWMIGEGGRAGPDRGYSLKTITAVSANNKILTGC